MKKKLFLFIVFLLILSSCSPVQSPALTPEPAEKETSVPPTLVPSEPLTFADPVLKAVLMASIGKSSGDITAEEAASITELNLSSQWRRYIPSDQTISDLQGLEAFVNLQSLDLSFQSVSDLRPLAGLVKLKSLSLAGNPISDLSPLAELTGLERLMLSACEADDYSVLSKLLNLEYLMLDHSKIEDLSVLSPLTKLKALYLEAVPTKNFFPLKEIYTGLELKDFTLSTKLVDLGFYMDDEKKQAILDAENASVRINHLEWGEPSSEENRNCVSIVLSLAGYKVSIGYYPAFNTYVVLATRDGSAWAINYLYSKKDNKFSFSVGDEATTSELILSMFGDSANSEALLIPIDFFEAQLKEVCGLSATSLFDMPFDENDRTLLFPYNKFGFTLLDFKATCIYTEQTPPTVEFSIHRPEWDQNANAELIVDWNMEFIEEDVNGYKMTVFIYMPEGRYQVILEKDGLQSRFASSLFDGYKGEEYPDLETVHLMANDAFGTQGKELYQWPATHLEAFVQAHFGMSLLELYNLPIP